MEIEQNASSHFFNAVDLAPFSEVTRKEVAEWNDRVSKFKSQLGYSGQAIPARRFKEHPAFEHLKCLASRIVISNSEDDLDDYISGILSKIGKSESGDMLFSGKGERSLLMAIKGLEAKRELAYDRDDNAVIAETTVMIEFYSHLHCILWYAEGLATELPIVVAVREADYV